MRGLMVVALVSATGCSGGWEESEVGGLRVLDAQRSSNISGERGLRIDVLDDETAFLVSIDPEGAGRTFFDTVRAPDGERVYEIGAVFDSGRPKTGGQYSMTTNSLNWPVDDTDRPLNAGRWSVRAGFVAEDDTYASGMSAAIRVALKSDDDFANGALRVRLVYLGAVGEDADIVAATEDAVSRWEVLYDDFGIDLSVRYAFDDSTEAAGAPGEASGALYERLSGESDPGEITLILAEEIDGQPGIQGYAGGVPGHILPSGRSVLVMSALDNSGGDLSFNDEETRLLAETMGHEVGHLLGLFHPVELDYDAWDGLDDTPECTSQTSCFNQMDDNLMFPVPVCYDPDACEPQTIMTADQLGVMHRSVWVNE